MNSFLGRVSEYLLKISDGDPGKLCVVFPNRRAGLFLKKELANRINGPVWVPDIFSIEDLTWKISGLRKADMGELLLLLYRIYRRHQQKDPEKFEEFCKWAPTLLNDFGETDNYLVDTKKLFVNLADIKEIEQWSLREKELTDFQKQYIHFWDSIGHWYRDLRDALEKSGQAYYGLAARHASENAVQKISDIGWKKIIFAGFNALSPAEKKIITSLVNAGLAETLWDGDRYYVEDETQEAGKYFRRYMDQLISRKENKFPFENISDELSTEEKNITITGVARNVSQAKAAAQFLSTLQSENVHSEKTCIVLADESLLFPLLYSLPFDGAVNVTMGYPLKNTSAATLLNALFFLQENATKFNVRSRDKEIKFYHGDLSRLFRHPLFTALSGGNKLAECWNEFLNRTNAIFCSASSLRKEAERKSINTGDAMLLFSLWNNEEDAIGNISSIIHACRTRIPVNEHGFSMEVEFLFHLDQLLNRARTLLQKFDVKNDLAVLRSLMEQQISSTLVPFSGEPVRGLQVMGLLETRVLDFENVILLSANENLLPSGKNNSTFIIYELRKNFGLPVFSDRDAIFAYHFYHLLQRAKNIFITYNTDADLTGIKEKSRFITQLIHELPGANKKAKITQAILDPGLHADARKKIISVEKNEEVLKAVAAFGERGFSPSSLNNYIACPLKFYLHNVLGIREYDEVEEAVDAQSLGTIMHLALEKLYAPAIGKKADAAFYQAALLNAERETQKAFDEYYSDEGSRTGKNLLAKKIAYKYINQLLLAEKAELPGGVSEILSLETEMETMFEAGGRIVRIKGTADRIEKRNGRLRVIDYKTGSVDEKELEVENISLLATEHQLSKALQLIMYGMLYRKKNPSHLPITSGIISFRKHKSGILLCEITGENILEDEKLDAFENILREIITSVFDPEKPFDQTTDEKICERCDFSKMCGRESKNK